MAFPGIIIILIIASFPLHSDSTPTYTQFPPSVRKSQTLYKYSLKLKEDQAENSLTL